MKIKSKIITCSLLLLLSTQSQAYHREWYVSWGYSNDNWGNSDIHIAQPAQGNDFTIYNVKAHDDASLTGVPASLFGPQYNIRVGFFVDEKSTWAIELNYDHTKYRTNLNQMAYVEGRINGQPVASNQILTENYFHYVMNNGANHLMINAMKRIPLHNPINSPFSLSALGRFGVGIVLPHSENTVLGNHNDVGLKTISNAFGFRSGWWQFGGVTTGIELGLRGVIYKGVYLELTDKEVLTYFSQIPVFQGRADQTIWLNEVILSLGLTFDGAKQRS